MNPEHDRLEASRKGTPWKAWGPYLSERQWGTVREDYGDGGNSWAYFGHHHSGSRAYRWGEDGLGGISDDQQLLCFALTLWNGKDPVLKERLFGLTNGQGNHGEDVKEYYYYLDSTPTHSYMKYLYKYPHAEYPYADLVNENARRGFHDPEYELFDTGVFAESRYFDVVVEYAKQGPDDILIMITATNRGPETATLRVLPTLWFRNTWSGPQGGERPRLSGERVIHALHPTLGAFELHCDGSPSLLYADNETNNAKLFGGTNVSPYPKDGINDAVVHGAATTNPEHYGTKVAADYPLELSPGQSHCVRLRLTAATQNGAASKSAPDPFGDFDGIVDARRAEADTFFASILPSMLSDDERNIARQALAGMMWTKQYYEYDVGGWLQERANRGLSSRNASWGHMRNHDILSMPDKWEYPWYATWDSGFHTLALVLIDPDFAKEQLTVFLTDRYMHPNGQLPAYEWNFSDVNPPVHPIAVYDIYALEKSLHGHGDIEFLKQSFDRLRANFSWWKDAKDPTGKNTFEGGFLGLDNIGVFDRSSALPTGGSLEQSDATAWVALFAQKMFRCAAELAAHDPSYEDIALEYLEEFLTIGSVMDRIGLNEDEMWDEDDGFFYDVLRFPDGRGTRLKVRSLVGLLPLCATSVLPRENLERLPRLKQRYEQVAAEYSESTTIACPQTVGEAGRRLLSIVDEEKTRRLLARMLDSDEFLSEFGIRSLSRFHAEHPYTFDWNGQQFCVAYLPGESDSGMFGGNSNWRGPIWMPMNYLLLRALMNLYSYYGDSLKVEFPHGSGRELNLFEVQRELSQRIVSMFTRDAQGRRPIHGGQEILHTDPHWRDLVTFYEYFHGDDGSGIGASHQTGWTGLVTTIMVLWREMDAERILQDGLMAAAAETLEP